MVEKKYLKIKSEIASKKLEADKPKHSQGLMNELQNMISDLYDKVDNLNERINVLENK